MKTQDLIDAIGGREHRFQYEIVHGRVMTYVDKASFDRVVKVCTRLIQQRDDWRNGHFKDDDDINEKWENQEDEQLLRIARGES